ncbi:MAG: hypothetical protein IJ291_07220 [Lachnospiraceae bacterium]|nr:hypothetical protein [Lachnospiraceae bacterium]
MENKEEIEKVLMRMIESTITLSFPMFSNEMQKQKILNEKKEKIEQNILDIVNTYDINISLKLHKNKIWDECRKKATESFDSLPEKMQLNSFYLQEVMHLYAERLSELVLNEL